MDTNKTILLTGTAGFIGSYLLGFLNKQGYNNIIIADDFSDEDKWFNFDDKQFIEKVERDTLFDWLKTTDQKIDFVFHLGARTDTTEFNYSIHEKLNVEYSKNIWNYCVEKNIPLVYASSAATYGSGELGYKDDHDIIDKLQPLNPYGVSKNEFDKWVLEQTSQQPSSRGEEAAAPPFWAGLKFFNVYGPNEYHKERMASMIFHGYNQIRKTGEVKLFKSHKPEYKDGEQLRDFIYVEDVAKVMYWMMNESAAGLTTHNSTLMSGIYNLGTGKARRFNDQINAIFATLNKEPNIRYIDMPEDIRDKYQYFTEADMTKLIAAGYTEKFYTLEEGIADYVKRFLIGSTYY